MLIFASPHPNNQTGGNIPDKYYVVTNDDVIRIKYILAYVSRDKHSKRLVGVVIVIIFIIIVIVVDVVDVVILELCKLNSHFSTLQSVLLFNEFFHLSFSNFLKWP